MIGPEGESGEASGARGAAAFAREKHRFEVDPMSIWNDFRGRSRSLLRRALGAPTGYEDRISELPFHTYATLKRTFAAVAAIANSLEEENYAMAKARSAQTLRWMALALESPRDPVMAYRLTCLPDPISIVTPSRVTTALDLNSTILSPAQLTATIGLSRDLELAAKRIAGLQPQRGLEDEGEKGKVLKEASVSAEEGTR